MHLQQYVNFIIVFQVWEDNKLVWLKSLIDVQSCLFCHKDATVLAGSNKIIGLKSKDGSILFETHLPINLSIHSSVISLLMNPGKSLTFCSY